MAWVTSDPGFGLRSVDAMPGVTGRSPRPTHAAPRSDRRSVVDHQALRLGQARYEVEVQPAFRKVSRGVVGAAMRPASAPTTPRPVGRGADGGIEPRRVRSMWHGPRNRGSRNRSRDIAGRRGLRARTPCVHRFDRRPELSRSDHPVRRTPACNDRKPSGGTRHRPNGQTSSGRKSILGFDERRADASARLRLRLQDPDGMTREDTRHERDYRALPAVRGPRSARTTFSVPVAA